jgi:hypothetical protein
MKNQKFNPFAAYWLLAIISSSLLTGAAALVDPTRPPNALLPESKKLSVSGPLQLSATFVYPERQYAIINGQVGAVGDKVGSYTIINIDNDTVELKGSQETPVVLSLFPTVKKASVAKQGL